MDEDSLSRRAADVTADLNYRAAVDRLNDSTWSRERSGSAVGGGGGGASLGVGGALTAAIVISAIAGGFGGAQWFMTALLLTGGAVVFVFVVGGLTSVVRQSRNAAIGRRSLGLVAIITLGAIAGAGLGALVPVLLGDDIPMREGILTLAPIGAIIGAIAGTLRLRRRR